MQLANIVAYHRVQTLQTLNINSFRNSIANAAMLLVQNRFASFSERENPLCIFFTTTALILSASLSLSVDKKKSIRFCPV